MRPIKGVIAFAVLATGAVAGPAFAAEPAARAPMLVVVEAGPGAGCDAEAVRAAIAAELRAAVVAPMTAPPDVALAGSRADTLLVAIDRERIVVTLRGRGEHDLTRTVTAPAERAARLRVVAWLAGNVARDQLASLPLPDASGTPRAAPAAEAVETMPAAPPSAAVPPAAAPPSLEPPAFATSFGAPEAVLRAEGVAPPSDYPRWTFSLGVGTGSTFRGPYQTRTSSFLWPKSSFSSWDPTAQLEAHRHFGAWFVGGALDFGPTGIHPGGAAVLFGAQWIPGRLRLEASGGAGVEVFVDRTYYGKPMPYVSETLARGYGRAALAASYPLSPRFDVLAQAGVHVTATRLSDAGVVVGTLGLRMGLR